MPTQTGAVITKRAKSMHMTERPWFKHVLGCLGTPQICTNSADKVKKIGLKHAAAGARGQVWGPLHIAAAALEAVVTALMAIAGRRPEMDPSGQMDGNA